MYLSIVNLEKTCRDGQTFFPVLDRAVQFEHIRGCVVYHEQSHTYMYIHVTCSLMHTVPASAYIPLVESCSFPEKFPPIV